MSTKPSTIAACPAVQPADAQGQWDCLLDHLAEELAQLWLEEQRSAESGVQKPVLRRVA